MGVRRADRARGHAIVALHMADEPVTQEANGQCRADAVRVFGKFGEFGGKAAMFGTMGRKTVETDV
ncbi:MAG: hypothetical protein EBT83_09060, partial [Betaproteobacteria bacterium]|nr:hypothetical protein [Betaproteobacteria bacterium]